MVTTPDREAAVNALAEIDTARRAVTAEDRRGRPVLLAAWSALTVIDYAAKDHVPSRSARWGITALCNAGTLGLGLLENRSRRVQPVSVDPKDVGPRPAAPMAGFLVGWAAAERVVVYAFRRSGVRRPNTGIGAVLALTRPVAYLAVLRLLPTPDAR